MFIKCCFHALTIVLPGWLSPRACCISCRVPGVGRRWAALCPRRQRSPGDTWVPRLWAQNPRRHFHLPHHHQIQGLSSSARWAPECQLSLGAPLLPLFLFLFIYLLIWLYRVLVVAHRIFCGTWTQAPDRSGSVVAALALVAPQPVGC